MVLLICVVPKQWRLRACLANALSSITQRWMSNVEPEAFVGAVAGPSLYPISNSDNLNGIAAFEAVSLSAATRSVNPIGIN